MIQKKSIMNKLSGCSEEAIAAVTELIKERNEWKLKTMKLIEKYELPGNPEFKYGVYLCPTCYKRVKPRHNRCHICGKLLSWEIES